MRATLARLSAASRRALPFEKPLFESAILEKEAKNAKWRLNAEFWGEVAVGAAALSLIYRCGYWIVYGKNDGAGPLPLRDRPEGASNYDRLMYWFVPASRGKKQPEEKKKQEE